MNSYASYTRDGKGIHIIVRGTLPPGVWQYSNIKIVNYGPLALSGRKVSSAPAEILDGQVQLEWLLVGLWRPISVTMHLNEYANCYKEQAEGNSSSSVVHQSSAQEAPNPPVDKSNVPAQEAERAESLPVGQQYHASNGPCVPGPTVDRRSIASPTVDASSTSSEAVEKASRALAEVDEKLNQKATTSAQDAPPAPSRADDSQATSTSEEGENEHLEEIKDLFELGLTRLNWKKLARRTRAIDHRAYFVILNLMRSAKSDIIHLSSRYLAEMAGMTSQTASKVLRRLQAYGLLSLVGKSDYYKKGHIYRLVKADTIKRDLAEYLLDEPKEAINVEMLIKYAGHDAFLHGAKLLIDGHYTLGPCSLEVLCALIAEAEKNKYSNQGLHLAEIARRTGLSSATVSKKAKALAQLGLVSMRKQGRRQVVRLISLSIWEEVLERKRHLLSTNGKTQNRKEKHTQERKEQLRKAKPVTE